MGALARPLTIERKGRIHTNAKREAARGFYANARGTCDDCHGESLAVYLVDSDEGWQSCVDCYSDRAGRKAVRRAEKVAL